MHRLLKLELPNGLRYLGLGVALLLLVPLAGIFTSLFTADSAAWTHISRTTLPELVSNSLILAVSVAAGVVFIGTLCAWVTAQRDFPGRAAFEWLLILPLAMPANVMAYTYTDVLQYAGPLQSALRLNAIAVFAPLHWQIAR